MERRRIAYRINVECPSLRASSFHSDAAPRRMQCDTVDTRVAKGSLGIVRTALLLGEWHHCWRGERRHQEEVEVALRWWLQLPPFRALVVSGAGDEDGGDDGRKREVKWEKRVGWGTLRLFPLHSAYFFFSCTKRLAGTVAQCVRRAQEEALVPPATMRGGGVKRSGQQVVKRNVCNGMCLSHVGAGVCSPPPPPPPPPAGTFPPTPIASFQNDTLPAYVLAEHERADLAP